MVELLSFPHFKVFFSITKNFLKKDNSEKMWYIYTMEYYSAIKRNEIGSFVETWMDLECRTE